MGVRTPLEIAGRAVDSHLGRLERFENKNGTFSEIVSQIKCLPEPYPPPCGSIMRPKEYSRQVKLRNDLTKIRELIAAYTAASSIYQSIEKAVA